jgi:F-type H+-transporting ATPase subunit delta
MSKNPLASKIAVPYARALYDYSVEQNVMHKITADFQNLEGKVVASLDLQDETQKLVPVFTSKDQTAQERIFISEHLGKFFKVLVKRNRLNLASEISKNYLELVYKTASVKMVEVSTAFPFTTVQKLNLIKKLKELTNAREIRLVVTVDSSLIGGFLIKIDSNVLDFTIKNQLENLAKKLDWSRGIENLEQWI